MQILHQQYEKHILLKLEPEQYNGLYTMRFDVIDTGDGVSKSAKRFF